MGYLISFIIIFVITLLFLGADVNFKYALKIKKLYGISFFCTFIGSFFIKQKYLHVDFTKCIKIDVGKIEQILIRFINQESNDVDVSHGVLSTSFRFKLPYSTNTSNYIELQFYKSPYSAAFSGSNKIIVPLRTACLLEKCIALSDQRDEERTKKVLTKKK